MVTAAAAAASSSIHSQALLEGMSMGEAHLYLMLQGAMPSKSCNLEIIPICTYLHLNVLVKFGEQLMRDIRILQKAKCLH